MYPLVQPGISFLYIFVNYHLKCYGAGASLTGAGDGGRGCPDPPLFKTGGIDHRTFYDVIFFSFALNCIKMIFVRFDNAERSHLKWEGPSS